ncbi:MAG: hypothetical protein AAFW84_09820 [Cyanobacteria bacterium J06635_15]
MPAASKNINWDYIIESYGEEGRSALNKLLAEGEVDESTPAATVIAGLFLSQIDSNKAFRSLSAVIDDGKQELSEEFKAQIIQLRGIISFAQEHLVETGQQEIDKRQGELLDVVKNGISKAIGNHNRSASTRTAAYFISISLCTFIVSVVSIGIGAFGLYAIQPKKSEIPDLAQLGSDQQALLDWSQTEDGQIWLNIISSNQEQLNTCIDNRVKLEGRCAIELP